MSRRLTLGERRIVRACADGPHRITTDFRSLAKLRKRRVVRVLREHMIADGLFSLFCEVVVELTPHGRHVLKTLTRERVIERAFIRAVASATPYPPRPEDVLRAVAGARPVRPQIYEYCPEHGEPLRRGRCGVCECPFEWGDFPVVVTRMEHDWIEPLYLWGRHTCKRCGTVLIDSERLVPCGAVETSYYYKDGKALPRRSGMRGKGIAMRIINKIVDAVAERVVYAFVYIGAQREYCTRGMLEAAGQIPHGPAGDAAWAEELRTRGAAARKIASEALAAFREGRR